MQIYLARNNQQAGPYSLEQLNQMLAAQQVLLTDLAWHQGMTEWKALGELTQGKSVYSPEGYVAPAPEPTPFQAAPAATVTQKTAVSAQNSELASIPSRILAKIVDVLLWIPAPFLLTAFFGAEAQQTFMELNAKFMETALTPDADPSLLQQIQTQMLQLIPDQAYIAAGIYLLLMLAVQAFMISKSGQSIGKKLTKIRIADAETGEKTSLLRAFTVRSVFFIFLNILFFPLSTIIDSVFGLGKNRQTLHDKLAKTKVVKH